MKKMAFVLAIFITLIFYLIEPYLTENTVHEMAYVEKVTDGDTIKTDKGTIRLLGINTPEKGQPYYQEAKDFLAGLIEGKNVSIEGKENDQYERLLRYVYLKNVFVNLEIVKNGFASVYMADGIKYENELIKAEKTAKENNLGIWKTGEHSSCFSVSEFVFNAERNDNKNLNGEYFTLENSCNAIDMNGWTIKDNGRNKYIFSKFVISSSVTIYTGCGNNTEHEIYMCRKRAVWNNDGDVLFLRDKEGNLVLSYGY